MKICTKKRHLVRPQARILHGEWDCSLPGRNEQVLLMTPEIKNTIPKTICFDLLQWASDKPGCLKLVCFEISASSIRCFRNLLRVHRYIFSGVKKLTVEGLDVPNKLHFEFLELFLNHLVPHTLKNFQLYIGKKVDHVKSSHLNRLWHLFERSLIPSRFPQLKKLYIRAISTELSIAIRRGLHSSKLLQQLTRLFTALWPPQIMVSPHTQQLIFAKHISHLRSYKASLYCANKFPVIQPRSPHLLQKIGLYILFTVNFEFNIIEFTTALFKLPNLNSFFVHFDGGDFRKEHITSLRVACQCLLSKRPCISGKFFFVFANFEHPNDLLTLQSQLGTTKIQILLPNIKTQYPYARAYEPDGVAPSWRRRLWVGVTKFFSS